MLLHEEVRKNLDTRSANTALVCDGKNYTFQDLENLSNQYAHFLLNKGINRGDYVGVGMVPSLEQVLLLLALSKIGAAYLPIDPFETKERQKNTLEQTKATCLISFSTEERIVETNIPRFNLDNLQQDLQSHSNLPPNVVLDATVTVYGLPTSGRGSGVARLLMVTHKNLEYIYTLIRSSYGTHANESIAAATSIGFDPSIWNCLKSWILGSPLVILPQDVIQDGEKFCKFLETKLVNSVLFVPSHIRKMGLNSEQAVKQCYEHGLRTVEMTGEAPDVAFIRAAHKFNLEKFGTEWKTNPDRFKVKNCFGPSETPIGVTAHEVFPEHLIEAGDGVNKITLVSSGKPAAGRQIRVLTAELEDVAVGAAGDVYIQGNDMVAGYFANPTDSAARFLQQPDGSTLFKTGDMGYLNASGDFVYTGRGNQYVKIKGKFVNLDEVNTALLACPGVVDACSVDKDDELIAFLVTNLNFLSSDAFMSIALTFLLQPQQPEAKSKFEPRPNYVPDAFVAIDSSQMQRTTTGKADPLKMRSVSAETSWWYTEVQSRKPMTYYENAILETVKKQAVDNAKIRLEQRYRENISEGLAAEEAVKQLTAKVEEGLKQFTAKFDHESCVIKPIFAFGIRSWDFVQLNNKIYEALGAGLRMGLERQLINMLQMADDVFINTVKEKQLQLITGLNTLAETAVNNVDPVFCVHPLTGVANGDYSTIAKEFLPDMPFFGINHPGLADPKIQSSSIQAIAEVYVRELKKRNPTGPIKLVGWSMAVPIIWEMLAILERDPLVEVEAVLIDAIAPEHYRNLPTKQHAQHLLYVIEQLESHFSEHWPKVSLAEIENMSPVAQIQTVFGRINTNANPALETARCLLLAHCDYVPSKLQRLKPHVVVVQKTADDFKATSTTTTHTASVGWGAYCDAPVVYEPIQNCDHFGVTKRKELGAIMTMFRPKSPSASNAQSSSTHLAQSNQESLRAMMQEEISKAIAPFAELMRLALSNNNNNNNNSNNNNNNNSNNNNNTNNNNNSNNNNLVASPHQSPLGATSARDLSKGGTSTGTTTLYARQRQISGESPFTPHNSVHGRRNSRHELGFGSTASSPSASSSSTSSNSSSSSSSATSAAIPIPNNNRNNRNSTGSGRRKTGKKTMSLSLSPPKDDNNKK